MLATQAKLGKKKTSAKELIIQYVREGIISGTLGTFCIGKLYRDGLDIVTILWPEFHDELLENPATSHLSREDALSALESLISRDVRESTNGRDQRHRFTSYDEWLKIVDNHDNGDGRRTIQWAGNYHCLFLPMATFGLTPGDFRYFRKAKVVKAPRPKRLREPVMGIGVTSVALKLPLDLAAKLNDKYPTLRNCSAVRQIVQMIDKNGGLEPVSVDNLIQYPSSNHVRINVSLDFVVQNKLITFANANDCCVADILRSMIAGHPYWDQFRKTDFV
jgi:hypothetical protein